MMKVGDSVYLYTNVASEQIGGVPGPYAGYVTAVYDEDTLDVLQVTSGIGTGTGNARIHQQCKRKGKHTEPWTCFWTERE